MFFSKGEKMNRVICCFAAMLLSGNACEVHAQSSPASLAFPRATPESQAVDSESIIRFIEKADREVNSIHSLMIVRNGYVVTEAWWKPEAAEKNHILWSLSKSFTSTAVGFAVQEGKLSIDDLVMDFFPDKLPEEPSKNLLSMRVRDLLTMSAGHEVEVNLRSIEGDWVEAFLNHPVPHIPGTHFKYNTPATYMLSAIVQKVTGETVLDYLQPRLFKPLGIKNPEWETSPQGISLGGYGLYVRTEDIAKLGQLYLQKGKWNGMQLLPSSWIDLATTKQVSNGSNPDNDWNQGYGFQFWRCRHNAFRGDGKDGQFCIVLPEKNAVIAITSKTNNMGKELQLIWDELLPAFNDKPLQANEGAQKKLKSLISGLEL